VPEPDFNLLVTPPDQRGLDRLPASLAAAVVEFLLGDLRTAPYRVGKALRGDLAGTLSARRGPYRVVYEVDETLMRINVLRIDHRVDVYR